MSFDVPPYVDTPNLQVCAIGAKRRLSPRITGIARQLATLLMNSQEVSTRNIEIEIVPLNDPTTFIEFLQTAYAISSFSISFRKPNPFEADEDIHKPLQRYLQHLNGEKGKATFTGEQLDPVALEKLALSAATGGDQAEARLQTDASAQIVRKTLQNNAITIQHENTETEEDKKTLYAKMMQQVRKWFSTADEKESP